MSRKLLWILTVVIAIASIGLIFLQSRWIGVALQIKEEQFVQTASLAMERIIDEVEKQETVFQVIDEIKPYYSVNTKSSARLDYQQNILNKTKSGIRTKQINQQVLTFSSLDSVKIPSITKKLWDSSLVSINNGDLHIPSLSKGKNLKNIDLGLDEKLVNKTIFVENIVDKMIRVELPIQERISQVQLDSIVRRELLRKGIKARYEYRITNERDSTIYASTKFKADFKGLV